MKVTLFFIFLILSTSSQAVVDPWNTYQWNKKNVAAGNGLEVKYPWYEWWYYKVVIPETGRSFFFVYGIVNPWDHNQELKGTRSYVGMGDFAKNKQVEEIYKIEDFSASYSETSIMLNQNFATDKQIQGSLKDELGHSYQWDISVNKKWSYNAEGRMLGTMNTDIEWYPAQASASCSGTIISGGEEIKFQNAPCYQDRNWGKQFPDWWTWIVSNQFEGYPDTALAIGGGKPHVRGMRTPIASVSVGFTHLGKDYSFRPIDLQYIKTDVSFGKWSILAIGRKYKIEVEAHAPKEAFMDLQFMTPTGEVFHDYETLTGNVTVNLYEREGLGFKSIVKLSSNFAGIEFGSSDAKRSELQKQNLGSDIFLVKPQYLFLRRAQDIGHTYRD